MSFWQTSGRSRLQARSRQHQPHGRRPHGFGAVADLARGPNHGGGGNHNHVRLRRAAGSDDIRTCTHARGSRDSGKVRGRHRSAADRWRAPGHSPRVNSGYSEGVDPMRRRGIAGAVITRQSLLGAPPGPDPAAQEPRPTALVRNAQPSRFPPPPPVPGNPRDRQQRLSLPAQPHHPPGGVPWGPAPPVSEQYYCQGQGQGPFYPELQTPYSAPPYEVPPPPSDVGVVPRYAPNSFEAQWGTPEMQRRQQQLLLQERQQRQQQQQQQLQRLQEHRIVYYQQSSPDTYHPPTDHAWAAVAAASDPWTGERYQEVADPHEDWTDRQAPSSTVQRATPYPYADSYAPPPRRPQTHVGRAFGEPRFPTPPPRSTGAAGYPPPASYAVHHGPIASEAVFQWEKPPQGGHGLGFQNDTLGWHRRGRHDKASVAAPPRPPPLPPSSHGGETPTLVAFDPHTADADIDMWTVTTARHEPPHRKSNAVGLLGQQSAANRPSPLNNPYRSRSQPRPSATSAYGAQPSTRFLLKDSRRSDGHSIEAKNPVKDDTVIELDELDSPAEQPNPKERGIPIFQQKPRSEPERNTSNAAPKEPRVGEKDIGGKDTKVPESVLRFQTVKAGDVQRRAVPQLKRPSTAPSFIRSKQQKVDHGTTHGKENVDPQKPTAPTVRPIQQQQQQQPQGAPTTKPLPGEDSRSGSTSEAPLPMAHITTYDAPTWLRFFQGSTEVDVRQRPRARPRTPGAMATSRRATESSSSDDDESVGDILSLKGSAMKGKISLWG